MGHDEVGVRKVSAVASLRKRDGQLGIVTESAIADLIVVDGDPSCDLDLFQHGGAHIPPVIKAGVIVKNLLV